MPDRPFAHWPFHPGAPGARDFAVLSGIEAVIRAIQVSVMPVAMYSAFGDAGTVSTFYFAAGVVSLLAGLLVPWGTRILPRRWMFTAGVTMFLFAAAAAVTGGWLTAAAVLLNMVATVTVFVCLNAYVLDSIPRTELPRSESLRLFYTGLAWTAGPVAGVVLYEAWAPAPFLVAAAAALMLLAAFWAMRLGNGRLIVRARGPAPNPLAYLGRFLAQPRLVSGWWFATLRSCGWWVFVVYLPIFAIEAGLGPRVGGVCLSLSSALLFAAPLMQRAMRGRPVRVAVRLGFLGSGALFAAAAPAAGLPWAAVGLLLAAAGFLVFLDVFGGLPFLMAVKPSERTEMAAIYSSFRDASNVLTPGLAGALLLVAPLPAVFAAAAAGLLSAWVLAGRLHPRLGMPRRDRPGPAGRPADAAA